MALTSLDMQVLKAVADYYVLNREQIQTLCSPDHASGRGTRKRLLRLREAGYVVKHSVQVALPSFNSAAPVYYPTSKGAEALANYFDDEQFLVTNTKTPRADRLAHWIEVNSTRMMIEKAAASMSSVRLIRWINEWETVNKDDSSKERYCLHTQLSETPPLSCSPDAGFLIEHAGSRMVYYLERDLETSNSKQIAARKSKGYAELARIEGHRKHFPETTVLFFRVLFITTSESRARATHEIMRKFPGSDLWFMINAREINDANFFTSAIAIDSSGDKRPLFKTT